MRLAGPAGCGVTVVLAHGFMNWHRHPKIHEFATRLAQHVNVLVPDMRGHGYSKGTSTLGALEYLDVAAAVAQVPASDAVVSGLKGAYARIDFTLEATGVGSFPTTSELWIIPRGDYLFIMGAGTRQDEKTGSRAEIRAILDTVRIDP